MEFSSRTGLRSAWYLSDERFEKLDLYRKMIDFCVQAGIPAMHSHFGFIPEDPSSAQYKDFIEVMRGLATYARSVMS